MPAVEIKEGTPYKPDKGEKKPQDVKIIWKGNKIAKLIFATGKMVEFEQS